MLKNIKSSVIIQKIFNKLIFKNKLRLFRHNKSFQKKYNISLNDYKTNNGRYIIYESKIKGKEYNSENKLIFIGEYLNGERKKGKEYFYHEVKFEGEYVNGKREGFGKEYWGNGKLYYEGYYFNGKKTWIWKGISF